MAAPIKTPPAPPEYAWVDAGTPTRPIAALLDQAERDGSGWLIHLDALALPMMPRPLPDGRYATTDRVRMTPAPGDWLKVYRSSTPNFGRWARVRAVDYMERVLLAYPADAPAAPATAPRREAA